MIARRLPFLTRVAIALSSWARQGGVQTTVRESGRLRTVVDQLGIALLWRNHHSAFYLRQAARAAFAKAVRP